MRVCLENDQGALVEATWVRVLLLALMGALLVFLARLRTGAPEVEGAEEPAADEA